MFAIAIAIAIAIGCSFLSLSLAEIQESVGLNHFDLFSIFCVAQSSNMAYIFLIRSLIMKKIAKNTLKSTKSDRLLVNETMFQTQFNKCFYSPR